MGKQQLKHQQTICYKTSLAARDRPSEFL